MNNTFPALVHEPLHFLHFRYSNSTVDSVKRKLVIYIFGESPLGFRHAWKPSNFSPRMSFEIQAWSPLPPLFYSSVSSPVARSHNFASCPPGWFMSRSWVRHGPFFWIAYSRQQVRWIRPRFAVRSCALLFFSVLCSNRNAVSYVTRYIHKRRGLSSETHENFFISFFNICIVARCQKMFGIRKQNYVCLYANFIS